MTAQMPVMSVLWFAAVWWIVASIWVFLYPKSASFYRIDSFDLWQVFYPCSELVCTVHVKTMPQAHLLIVMLFMMIWVADCGAYFFGKRFGRLKLMVRVSPKKLSKGLLVALLAL